MLQQEFISLVNRHAEDQQLATRLWSELQSAYTTEERYFHNLSHLDQMFLALISVQAQVDDWDTLLLALFYHDAVYDVVQYVTNNDNEDRSADQAVLVLQQMAYPAGKIERCKQHILATKKHELSMDRDTNFLIDADLSILGQPWEVYENYRKKIRYEYGVYPDPIYHAGRAKVLRHFLAMERLFKTEPFFQYYEAAAKENIERELEIISFI